MPGHKLRGPGLSQPARLELHRRRRALVHEYLDRLQRNYAWVHSADLRTGGFSTTQWFRNFTPEGRDSLGRTLLLGTPGFATPLDPTLFSSSELGSFDRGNYHEFVLGVNKRFANRFQFFANYTWSRNFSNASSERDTETFFRPPGSFQSQYRLRPRRPRYHSPIQGRFGRRSSLRLHLEHELHPSQRPCLPCVFCSGLKRRRRLQSVCGQRPPRRSGRRRQTVSPSPRSRTPARFLQLGYAHRQGLPALPERYSLRLSADLFNITKTNNLDSDPDVYGFVGPTSNAVCTLL